MAVGVFVVFLALTIGYVLYDQLYEKPHQAGKQYVGALELLADYGYVERNQIMRETQLLRRSNDFYRLVRAFRVVNEFGETRFKMSEKDFCDRLRRDHFSDLSDFWFEIPGYCEAP